MKTRLISLLVNVALMKVLGLIRSMPARIDQAYHNAGRRAARANLDLIKTQPGR